VETDYENKPCSECGRPIGRKGFKLQVWFRNKVIASRDVCKGCEARVAIKEHGPWKYHSLEGGGD
jgi:hypothetical protein